VAVVDERVHKETAECPRCGAEYEGGQEFCLECGARLPVTRGVVSPGLRRRSWYPGDWVWPALAGLLIAGLATGVAIAVRDAGGDGTTVVATQPTEVAPPPAPEPLPPEPTVPNETSPVAPPPPPQAAREEIVDWPANTSGYTIVLESIPTTAGRALARRKARAALEAGLEDVGVLNSSRYSSLHPGYFVVFSGTFESFAAAQDALEAAQANGYRAAYARQITS
jgi:hypothetical protein